MKTVRDLIAELEKCDPNSRVVIVGLGDNYDDITCIEDIRLKLDINTGDTLGKHEEDDNGDCHAIRIY